MKSCNASYVKGVERNLDLPRRQRKKLLRGLQSELQERFAEPPSEEMLKSELGSPEEVAQALLLGVDAEEEKRQKKVRLLWTGCVAVMFALLLSVVIGLICYFDLFRPGHIKVTIIPDPAPSPQYSMDVEGE